jgi:hypothetical protein
MSRIAKRSIPLRIENRQLALDPGMPAAEAWLAVKATHTQAMAQRASPSRGQPVLIK